MDRRRVGRVTSWLATPLSRREGGPLATHHAATDPLAGISNGVPAGARVVLLQLAACIENGLFAPEKDDTAVVVDSDPPGDDTATSPPEELCNGTDDDGDGAVDEGFPDADGNGRVDCLDGECGLLPASAGTCTVAEVCEVVSPVPDAWVVRTLWEFAGPTVAPDATSSITQPLIVHLYDDDGSGGIDSADGAQVVTIVSDPAGAAWLVVIDGAASDTGRLNGWTLEVARGTATPMPAPTSRTYENTSAAPIPDNTPAGVSREIVVADAGAIRTMQVTVDITHPYRGDLTIALSKVGGSEVVLLRGDGADADDVRRTFDVTAFVGQELRGTWRLKVVDEARTDMGTLNFWRLTVAR